MWRMIVEASLEKNRNPLCGLNVRESRWNRALARMTRAAFSGAPKSSEVLRDFGRLQLFSGGSRGPTCVRVGDRKSVV